MGLSQSYVLCSVSCIPGEIVLNLYSNIYIPALKELLKMFFIDCDIFSSHSEQIFTDAVVLWVHTTFQAACSMCGLIG